MKSCNCTLAGTDACKNCIMDYWTAPDWSIFKLPDWLEEYTKINVYDPEKYDLVEKKDYKIKKLKESIEASKRQLGNNWALLRQLEAKSKEYNANVNQCEEDIRRMNQELQELESKKKE